MDSSPRARGEAKRLRYVFVFAVLGALLLMLACGPGFMDGLTSGHREAGVEEASVEAGRACEWAVPPDPPNIPDSPGKDVDLFFAVEAMRLDTNPRDSGLPPPTGLNQDSTCTCPEVESCVRFDAGRSRQTLCDLDGGRDNGLGAFFNQLGVSIPEFREEFATERIRIGQFTILIDVLGYNGERDDSSVTVRMRMSQGMDEAEQGGRSTPRFDGSDIWGVDPDSIIEGQGLIGQDCRYEAKPDRRACAPLIVDNQAFVRDGKLVARPRQIGAETTTIRLRTQVGQVVFEFLDTTIVADITPADQPGKYVLTGEIAGRWPVASMLQTVGNMENPLLPKESLCESADAAISIYGQAKKAVCEALDVAATASLDRTSASCAAVSSAIGFRASLATPGHVISKPKADAAPCLDFKDTCAN